MRIFFKEKRERRRKTWTVDMGMNTVSIVRLSTLMIFMSFKTNPKNGGLEK